MSVNWSNYAYLTIPEGKVKRIAKKDDGTILWEMSYINQVPLSIDESGAIYNGTGYKNKYRVRSAGAEASNESAVCTGYIPVKGGDTIRVSGCDFSLSSRTDRAINVYDANKQCLGQIVANYPDAGYGCFAYGGAYQASHCFNTVVEESEGVWRWTLPNDTQFAYIRVTGSHYSYNKVDGSLLIVTVNEEIKWHYNLSLTWKNGYKIGYDIGSTVTESVDSNYIITEAINVIPGKTYTINVVASSSSFGFYFIGFTNQSVVTEYIQHTPGKPGTFTYTWTPTESNTTKMRIRGYSTSADAWLAVTSIYVE